MGVVAPLLQLHLLLGVSIHVCFEQKGKIGNNSEAAVTNETRVGRRELAMGKQTHRDISTIP